MTEETNNKGMQQAKGGVLAQSDIELLRKSLEFYIKNSDDLSSIEESKASLLFHRLGSCLLYTSPSPRDTMSSRMPSSA